MIKFCHHLTKPIIARIIVSLVFKTITVRAAVLFSEILSLWLNRYKFCHCLTKPHYYTNYCVFSVVKCYYMGYCIVFRDFMSLVKHDQILSSFNQAYYCTNYCVFSV